MMNQKDLKKKKLLEKNKKLNGIKRKIKGEARLLFNSLVKRNLPQQGVVLFQQLSMCWTIFSPLLGNGREWEL